MSISQRSSWLRQVLIVDAVISGVTALLLLLVAGFLADMLDLPSALLRTAGLVLLPFVAFVAYVATRELMPRPAVWAVIGMNALWVVASLGLLLSSWAAPNALGTAFVIAQAVAVAAFAELQVLGVRRAMTHVT